MNRIATVAASLLALAGCSDIPDHPETYPVTGVVTKGGQPVAGVTVNFIPVTQGGDPRSARGLTDDSGRYQLNTYFSAAADVEGAVPGEYKITLFKAAASGGPAGHDPNWKPGSREMYMAARNIQSELPEQYMTQEKTPLSYTVKDEENTFDVKVE